MKNIKKMIIIIGAMLVVTAEAETNRPFRESVQEVRQEKADLLKQMREERDVMHKENKDNRMEMRGEKKENRDSLKQMREDGKTPEEIKKTRQMMLKENQEKRKEMIEQNKARREELKNQIKNKLENFKEAKKVKLDEARKERLENVLKNIFKKLNNALEKLAGAEEKITKKINDLKNKGAYTSKAEELLSSAIILRNEAISTVGGMQDGINSSIAESNEASKESIRAVVKTAMDAIKKAGEAYRVTHQELKNIVKPEDNSNKTSKTKNSTEKEN